MRRRRRRLSRLLQFIETHALDRTKFEELAERHGLGDEWRRWLFVPDVGG